MIALVGAPSVPFAGLASLSGAGFTVWLAAGPTISGPAAAGTTGAVADDPAGAPSAMAASWPRRNGAGDAVLGIWRVRTGI